MTNTLKMKAIKYISVLMICLITVGASVQAQKDKLAALRTSKKIVSVHELPATDDWAIQIIALKLPAEDPAFFKDIEYAREFDCADGYMKYCVESYPTYKEAKTRVAYFKELGYVQSFVVNTAQYTLNGKASAQFDPNANYTIQLSAFRFPVYLSYFEGVDNVMEFYLKDKVYRYTVGNYKHPQAEEALKELKDKGFKDAFITNLDVYMPFKIE